MQKMNKWLATAVATVALTVSSAAWSAASDAKYVMSSLGGRTVTTVGGSVTWSVNPTAWRYGRWGGQGWSDAKSAPQPYSNSGRTVDRMDELFRQHDLETALAGGDTAKIITADRRLLAGLKQLPKDRNGHYVSCPEGAPRTVTWRVLSTTYSMPFSEFARQQAMEAFTLKIAGMSTVRGVITTGL